jgi:hypothetical protein
MIKNNVSTKNKLTLFQILESVINKTPSQVYNVIAWDRQRYHYMRKFGDIGLKSFIGIAKEVGATDKDISLVLEKFYSQYKKVKK